MGEQPASPVHTNEPSDAAPSAATEENSAPSITDETQNLLMSLLAHQLHNQIVKDNFLSDLIESRSALSNSNLENNFRIAIVSLLSKTNIAEKDFVDIPLVYKSYQKLVEDVEAK